MAEEEQETMAASSSPKIEEAQRDVARAQAKFSADLERVSSAGRNLTSSILENARPALLSVAVVTGLLVLAAVWRARKSAGPRVIVRTSVPRSPLARELGSAAVRALAMAAGRHLATTLVAAAQQRVRRASLSRERSDAELAAHPPIGS